MTTAAATSAPTITAPVPAALRRVLTTATARLRMRLVLWSGSIGLLAGAGMVLLAVVLLRLRVWDLSDSETWNDLFFLVPPVAGLCIGAAIGAAQRIAPLDVLRFADNRLHFKERLSTAWVLLHQGQTVRDSDFAVRQIADADDWANRAPLKTALPLWPLPRVSLAALGVCACAFLVWFLPTFPLFQSPQARAEKQAVQKEGERLVRVAKALEKEAGKKKLPETKKAAASLAALGKQMQKGQMTKQKALMKVAKLTDAMRQAQQSLASQAAGVPKTLPGASKELAKALAAAQTMPKGDGDKQNLNAPPNNGANTGKNAPSSPSAQTAHKMQQALAQNDAPSLAEQLAKMADAAQRGEPGDKAGREKMTAQLSALSKALQNTSLSAASKPLADAASAMQKGDMAQAAQKIKEAAKKIADAQSKNADNEAMDKMAQAMGQNGAEAGQEGAQMADAGEGQGESDAFGKDGLKKGRGKGKGAGDGLLMGSEGEGEGTVNSIGSGVGKLGGKKPAVGKAGRYLDAANAPAENKTLNRKTETHQVRDDDFSRLYVPQQNATRLTGKRGEKGKETTSFFRGSPDKAASTTPYYEVYGQYAPAAESALNREDIPQTYKKQVKDYFDALRPAKK